MKPFTIILHISLLAASGAFDAHTTNALRARCTAANVPFTEHNPALRPFVSNPVLTYAAIIAGDQAVYWGLRYMRHKRAAEWWMRGETAENMMCAWNNARQHPVGVKMGFMPGTGAPMEPIRGRR